jgi:hypothetical protein
MHVNSETLERYSAGDLPAAEVATIHTHVSTCLYCAHSLAVRSVAESSWERRGVLGRLVRISEDPAPSRERDLDVRAA